MITVHHLNNSRSQRVLWLLEELGLEYEVKRYERDHKTMLAPPALLAVHPLGKSPVISHDGNTIAESGAIVQYLVDGLGAGKLTPAAGTPGRLRYTYWLHYAEGSLMPLLLLSLVFNRLETAPMPFFVKPVARGIVKKTRAAFIKPQLDLHLDFIEAELGKRTWLAGESFSAADVQMSFPLEAAAKRADLDASRPKTWSFLQAIHARPAYKRALERGGRYDFAT